MESKHTPGPWSYGNILKILKHGPDPWADHSSDEANARLIAAAPELLSVCYYVLESMDVGGEQSRAFFAEIFRLKEAIAKAKGG